MLSAAEQRVARAGRPGFFDCWSAKEAVLKEADARTAPLPVDMLLGRERGLDVYWAKE